MSTTAAAPVRHTKTMMHQRSTAVPTVSPTAAPRPESQEYGSGEQPSEYSAYGVAPDAPQETTRRERQTAAPTGSPHGGGGARRRREASAAAERARPRHHTFWFGMHADMPSGTWIASVRVHSMRGASEFWSEPQSFVIPARAQASSVLAIALASSLTALLLVLLLATAVITIILLKLRRKEKVVQTTMNPDYYTYTPDEWEIESDKVEQGRPLGQGSFGMVYEGMFLSLPLPLALRSPHVSLTKHTCLHSPRRQSVRREG